MIDHDNDNDDDHHLAERSVAPGEELRSEWARQDPHDSLNRVQSWAHNWWHIMTSFLYFCLVHVPAVDIRRKILFFMSIYNIDNDIEYRYFPNEPIFGSIYLLQRTEVYRIPVDKTWAWTLDII